MNPLNPLNPLPNTPAHTPGPAPTPGFAAHTPAHTPNPGIPGTALPPPAPRHPDGVSVLVQRVDLDWAVRVDNKRHEMGFLETPVRHSDHSVSANAWETIYSADIKAACDKIVRLEDDVQIEKRKYDCTAQEALDLRRRLALASDHFFKGVFVGGAVVLMGGLMAYGIVHWITMAMLNGGGK